MVFGINGMARNGSAVVYTENIHLKVGAVAYKLEREL